MSRSLFVSVAGWVFGALLSSVALAGGLDKSTPEVVIRDSLRLIQEGKVDEWVAGYCSKAQLCQTTERIDELKRYGLARAQTNAKLCLHDGAIQVTRTKGDPAKDPSVTLWIKCEEARLPVPATLVKTESGWDISSFSW
jgi:hypothetical protein